MARLYRDLLFLLHLLLQTFVQQGNDLVEIAHRTEVGHTEDRGVLVAVDGDDEVGFLHTGQMLDGTTPASLPSC